MSAKNSISQLLEQFLELNTNSLETFNRINEAISTDKETVVVDLYDPSADGVKSVQIPAFGYLKREIERLNANLESITDVENSGSTVRLKDGTYRKLFTSRLKGPSKPITSLAAPTKFNTKLNEFFEDFLNPLLTIKLDVSGQIPVETERVFIERFIFDSEDPVTLEQFDAVYKGQNEINYTDLKSQVADGSLKYYLDSEVIEMPVRTIQYYGKFDVTKITNEQKSVVVDGTAETKTIKLFTLNKLSYSDSSKDMMDTEFLKAGDSLAVNSGELKTRYTIKSIDNSTSQVELELMEGFEPIKIGSEQLSVYKDIDTDLDIEINVGFDERQIVFIKPIDPISSIPAEVYSPGVGFYSNDLEIEAADGTIKSLAQYYKEEVADFGQFIKALSVDYIPPASVGVTPSKPDLETGNFKVVQINKHLTDNTTTKKIKQLKTDKISAEQKLKNIDESIKQKKSLLNTKKFRSRVERDKQKNELTSLVSQRDSESKLFSSIVSEIKSSAESSDLAKVSPKYRVRGFWSIPEPRTIGNEVSQEVVQFKVRYRYVSTTGKTSQVEQIQFEDAGTSKTAAFSNWIEVDGPVRKREKGEDGKYKWITESEEDAQAVNFNSIDIPIRPGEIVEMMVKSVSEAGYPANPVMSDWSEIIKVEFPEGELSTDSLSYLVKTNDLDELKVNVNSDLEAAGVFQHVGDGFTAGDTYYAHTASTIASGFLSPEQTPISLYQKLVELQNEIKSLKAQIDKSVGELLVNIIDEEGNVTAISNNTTTKLFAGYYVNELPDSNQKGHIVTKNFKIQLSNSKASDLELISRIVGDTSQPAWISTQSTTFGLGSGSQDDAVLGNAYYTGEGRYDIVPVLYQNVKSVDLAQDYFNLGPEQSTQVRGQFIYSRYKNLANDDALYVDAPLESSIHGTDPYEYGLYYGYNFLGGSTNASGDWDLSNLSGGTYVNNGSAAADFIWNGNSTPGLVKISSLSSGSDTGNDVYDNGVFLHIDHPLLNDVSTPSSTDMLTQGTIGIPQTATLNSFATGGKKQTPFKLLKPTLPNGTALQRSTVKTSFEPQDQYLLGGKSCGSFLYLSPLDRESHVVNASNKYGKVTVAANGTNTISIDLVFQYRMTDYHGVGNTGTGRIGGIVNGNLGNITYSKKIGIDLLDSNDNSFQFDIEVYAKYKATGRNINSITSAQIGGPADPTGGPATN